MFGLPLNLHDLPSIRKIRITGLEGKLIKHGSAILDRQLRRLDQRPSDILDEEKRWLINNLGGHPLAIMLCADAIYYEGLTDVKKAIKGGSGFYRKVTDSILRIVTLTENDKEVLRLLSGCRIEAPRDVIASTCNFPAAQYISNLSRQCLIEIVSPTTIRLPGILRNRFKFNDINSFLKISFFFNDNYNMPIALLSKNDQFGIELFDNFTLLESHKFHIYGFYQNV